MNDSENCDNQSLLELIFYPDTEQQEQLEGHLAPDALNDSQVQAIEQYLAEKHLRARLAFPDGEKTSPFAISENVLQQYLRRLNLTRRIPPAVAEAIGRCVRECSHALLVRVKLRNTRFCFTEEIVSFLCAYLDRLPVASGTDIERLELALFLLDQMPEKADVYTALMALKHHCGEMIRQAGVSEQRLRQQPVEALIMQGVNIPCLSVDEARRRMNRIDEIALQVFGKTESNGPLGPGTQSLIDIDTVGSSRDLDKVIKTLS